MLKIYGQTRSRAFRVLWLCKESNIAFEQEPISIHVPNATVQGRMVRQAQPERPHSHHRRRRVRDVGIGGDQPLSRQEAQKPAVADARAGEGNMLQWAFYIANDIEPPMITVFQNRFVFPPDARRRARRTADKVLRPKLKVLDDYLAHTVFRRRALGHGGFHGGERDLEPRPDEVRYVRIPQAGELAQGEPRPAGSAGDTETARRLIRIRVSIPTPARSARRPSRSRGG